MSTASTPPEANALQTEIDAVFARWDDALARQDLEALGTCYASNVKVFDIAGSRLEGYDQLAEVWKMCFPYFPNPIGCQRKEMRLEPGSDLVVASYFSRMTGMETDHPSARSWLRTTTCFTRSADGWKICHEHSSLPVNCMEEKPEYILED